MKYQANDKKIWTCSPAPSAISFASILIPWGFWRFHSNSRHYKSTLGLHISNIPITIGSNLQPPVFMLELISNSISIHLDCIATHLAWNMINSKKFFNKWLQSKLKINPRILRGLYGVTMCLSAHKSPTICDQGSGQINRAYDAPTWTNFTNEFRTQCTSCPSRNLTTRLDRSMQETLQQLH